MKVTRFETRLAGVDERMRRRRGNDARLQSDDQASSLSSLPSTQRIEINRIDLIDDDAPLLADGARAREYSEKAFSTNYPTCT
jgi:hypothetical protein